jgi:hypothetical protein
MILDQIPERQISYGVAGFDLPNSQHGDRLQRILSIALKDRLNNQIPDRDIYPSWDTIHFGLDKVSIFQTSPPAEQLEILQMASVGLIAESYFIEKAGMGYMAKMVLLAESTEERMLYSLFAADEAKHCAQVSQFLPAELQANPNKDIFLNFLSQLVETEDRNVLLFVLQVVLEGWGISHYKSLTKNCHSPELSRLFASFLQDEAQHHRTGSLIFGRVQLSSSSRVAIVEALTLFLGMVQVGPQRILDAIATVKGDLSRSQRLKILEEIDTETHSGSRLMVLRSLMRQASDIVQELDDKGCFQPFPAYKCT